MSKIFIAGLINIETTLKVNSFPIAYSPIEYPFHGINNSISGVGYNILNALLVLNDEPHIYSYIGTDDNGQRIIADLNNKNVDISNIVTRGKTSESIVIYDNEGKRKIYCDLKDLQDIDDFAYVSDPSSYDLAILTNINFARPLIDIFAKQGVKIATDVHVLTDVNDTYNKDFLRSASILFLSNEGCRNNEENFIKEIFDTYHNDIIVMGCGDKGAIMYLKNEDRFIYEPAVAPLGIENTVGAGDALFSGFIHYYLKTNNPYISLKFAVYFAGAKIAKSGGSNGFLKEEEIIRIIKQSK